MWRLDNLDNAGQIRWVCKEDTGLDGVSVHKENLVQQEPNIMSLRSLVLNGHFAQGFHIS